MSRWIQVWALALVLAVGPSALAGQTLDLALIVGNNRHLVQSDRTLRYADDDALMAADRFRMLHPDGALWLLVDPDEETLLAHAGGDLPPYTPPDRAHWEAAIAEMEARAQAARAAGIRRIRLLVHFAGHGEPGGIIHLQDAPLTREAFRQSLARVGADRVFALMDGCHLGDLTRGDGASADPLSGVFLDEELALPGRPSWLGLIGSTASVPESGYLGSGLLTLVGLTGLMGPADLDGDQRVTFDEWSRYIYAQLGTLPGSPPIVAFPPGHDALAPVVDLSHSRAGGIRLTRSFGPGHIRIVDSETGALTAELYHHGLSDTTVRLRPGRYDLLRLGEREAWEFDGFPATRQRLTVGEVIQILDGSDPMEAVALVLTGSQGRGEVPQGVDVVELSLRDFFTIENSPFRRELAPSALRRPSWQIATVALLPAGGGPLLSETRAPGPGVLVGLGWLYPLTSRGRWLLDAGGEAGYTAQRYTQLSVGYGEVAPDALRHALRLGPTLHQTLLLPRLSVGLGLSAFYAPGLVSEGAAIASPTAGGGDPSGGSRRLVFPSSAGVAARVELAPVLSRSWQVAPTLEVNALHLRISDGEASVAVWRPSLALGLSLGRARPR